MEQFNLEQSEHSELSLEKSAVAWFHKSKIDHRGALLWLGVVVLCY